MDRETANAIREWIKIADRSFVGDRTEWARAYRRALTHFKEVVKHAEAGEIDRIKDVGA